MITVILAVIVVLIVLANIEFVLELTGWLLALIVAGTIIYFLPTIFQTVLLGALVAAWAGLMLFAFGKAVFCLCRFVYRTIARLHVRSALRQVSPEQLP